MAPKRRTKRRDAALRSRVPAATGRHAYRRRQSRTHSGRATAQRKSVGSQLKPRKGERSPALLCSTPITSTTKNGALLYQTAIMDLSERKRAEQALQESSQRLQATYERAPIGITECSPEGKYVGANEEFCRILGYRK